MAILPISTIDEIWATAGGYDDVPPCFVKAEGYASRNSRSTTPLVIHCVPRSFKLA